MQRLIQDLVRHNIKELKPFSSARSEYKGSAKVLIDANEMPYNNGHNRYPDPAHLQLRSALAVKAQIAVDQIICGNGSDELIDMIMRTFCEPSKDIVRYIYPSFGMYPVYADINDLQKEEVLLDQDFDLDVEMTLSGQSDRHKLLILCSPNNPTGNLLSEQKMLEVLQGWQGIVVVDEAYIEFADRRSLVDRLGEFPNLIVLQTFSKAKGGAGLRIGIAYANKEVTDYLHKVKPPYNITTYAQQRGLGIISNGLELSTHVAEIKQQRSKVRAELSVISGIDKIYGSDANFLLMKCRDHRGLYDYLVDRGIVVRDRSKLRGCEDCLRITIGTPEENQLLITSVNDFYA